MEPALDKGQIAAAALALLDEAGLEGLTMRSLADRLGVKAASLYWHVRGKQDVLGLLAEAICAPIQEPDRALPWLDQLEALAHEYRRALLAHRDSALVLAASGGAMGPARLRLSEIVLRTLLDAGLTPQDAARAGLMLNDYVVGFVAEEARAAAQAADPGQAEALAAWMAALPADQLPSIAALAPHLAEPPGDAQFRFGVAVLRAGLAAHLSAPGG